MSQDERYRQLALFSVIIAEVVITPVALGGLLFFLTKATPYRAAFAIVGALLGLGVAFYRISQMMKRQRGNGQPGK